MGKTKSIKFEGEHTPGSALFGTFGKGKK